MKMDRILHQGKSEFQSIAVFENALYGRVLALDNVVQTTERDEFFYHEMAVQVPMLAHGRVRRALIVGGGDGGALEEMLKHPALEAVTMAEIDGQVVEVAKQHLRSICGSAFEDPRTKLVIADGADYLRDCTERFDFILIDSTDPTGFAGGAPEGPGAVLFSAEFYARCKGCMNPGAVLVTQNAVPFADRAGLAVPMNNLRGQFADVACYRVAVPSFYGGEMVFSWGSDDPALSRAPLEPLQQRCQAAGLDTRYYTPETHVGAFALPGYLKEIIEEDE
jgi:spermidine synthase